eukprot:scaffold19954_cov17-Tisochrysis_lutea.AAC.1
MPTPSGRAGGPPEAEGLAEERRDAQAGSIATNYILIYLKDEGWAVGELQDEARLRQPRAPLVGSGAQRRRGPGDQE